MYFELFEYEKATLEHEVSVTNAELAPARVHIEPYFPPENSRGKFSLSNIKIRVETPKYSLARFA